MSDYNFEGRTSIYTNLSSDLFHMKKNKITGSGNKEICD